ncbi:hypothetical protein QBC36DRAFT_32505 [Triangularia setosa]|uniref:Uncharacterized protein n=1 Tax=Triangularia setosa TaxID=2587417 RepID=A0AAN6W4C1_9PEZI|nr:hypothetical protein QBC36DRAFT_32505 [Podospora setosa]
MRTFTTLLLALALGASSTFAAPSSNGIASENLSEFCSYSCACSGDDQLSQSSQCCDAIGGTLDERVLCVEMNYVHASAFVTCCGGSTAGFFCQNRIGCPVPDEDRK